MARLFGKDATGSDGLVTELSPILIPNFTIFYCSVAIVLRSEMTSQQ